MRCIQEEHTFASGPDVWAAYVCQIDDLIVVNDMIDLDEATHFFENDTCHPYTNVYDGMRLSLVLTRIS